MKLYTAPSQVRVTPPIIHPLSWQGAAGIILQGEEEERGLAVRTSDDEPLFEVERLGAASLLLEPLQKACLALGWHSTKNMMDDAEHARLWKYLVGAADNNRVSR